ncbi:peptidyl-prolyl cis-trans isomerase-like 3 isoform X3 [Nematostella vectensis]|uniref:peptidyl-prolyl cis-trans isomerase-like 3 isoform X3 n=1 Tax=Nematostella vectensis TaxID=45351 RepID=UPI00138FB577|nr:peptidyl-prolyl cis-trans isomerase-like 3 isoform X3 [Nematostella vectensis]
MSVTLQTDIGDLKIELFCEDTPRTCENFLALCASHYYDNCVFHRNIKGFMVQTGDPTGSGKGGKSIWGKKFEDELSPSLRHNARGTVSMANNGPNSNGSQFFICYGKQPHLDMKYTMFGKPRPATQPTHSNTTGARVKFLFLCILDHSCGPPVCGI